MFRHAFHKPRTALAAAAAVAAAWPLAASGAAAMSQTEQMLAAAGFQALPANTPERQADMAGLKSRHLIAQPHGDGFTYVYADPKGCACLYMGDAAAYQAYQQLAQQQKIARQYADAAQANRFGLLNWNAWGPYGGWGWQGPAFVHGRHGGFGSRRGGSGHR